MKAAARKPKKFTMAPSGVASMMDSGIGAGPTPNLDLHIQMIVRQMMEQNRPPPTERQNQLVDKVLGSMNLPQEAKKKIKLKAWKWVLMTILPNLFPQKSLWPACAPFFAALRQPCSTNRWKLKA